jgi:hypothetical protein
LVSWTTESFALSKRDTYGDPPLSKERFNRLSAAYVAQTEKDIPELYPERGTELAPRRERDFDTEGPALVHVHKESDPRD